jgi:hypothetical protein
MDGHFTAALQPVPDDMKTLAAWLRSVTRGTDVVMATGDVLAWVPALTGRRVVRAEAGVAPDAAHLSALGVRVVVAEAPTHVPPPPPPVPVRETLRAPTFSAWLLGP